MRRLRVEIRQLRRSPELARAIEAALAERPEVREAHASPITGRVLVLSDRDISSDTVARWIEGLRPEHESAAVAASAVTIDASVSLDVWLVELGHRGVKRVRRAISRLSERPWTEPRRARPAPARGRELPAPPAPWHTLEVDRVLAACGAERDRGLSAAEARRRASEYGENRAPRLEPRSELSILLDQVKSAPVALLGAAAVISALTGGVADAVAIGAVVVLNTAIGYVTESQAERIIGSLQPLEAADAVVLRDGERRSIAAHEVALGDLLLLSPGQRIAADARLVAAERLAIDESPLTGESMPSHKTAAALPDPRLPLADRDNMVFTGTLVTTGTGVAVVVAVGEHTELGRIQTLAGSVTRPTTPLQRQLDHLGRQLVVLSSLVCGAVFVVGLWRGYGALPMLQSAISLGVAAVPEGLPTVAITTLALGIRSMRGQGVLVRQLGAIETLGAVTTLCLDKTGTITENRMRLVALHVAGERLRVGADGSFSKHDCVGPATRLLEIASLCSEAEPPATPGERPRGSPTEAALLGGALACGVDVARLRRESPRTATHERTEARAVMVTVHRLESGRFLVAVKGRPDEVLACCSRRLTKGGVEPLDAAARSSIEAENDRMAGAALRVLGVAWREVERPDQAPPLDELVWAGLAGIADPPRPGTAELLERFRQAGIETKMITGDQFATAQAVARQIGLGADEPLRILDSVQLEELAPDALRALVGQVHAFARVTPAHKLEIVRLLQQTGRVVAMTGDGINDAPALRVANVGLAVGDRSGSAALDVADAVLVGDRLDAMANAIQQGRTIYDDIRKAVQFVLATNLSEILLTGTAVSLGLGQPLTPMQLLWINIITDVFPELALAAQPPDEDLMHRPPRDPSRPMFDRRDLAGIARQGMVISAAALGAYAVGLHRHGPGQRAGSLAFLSLTTAQLLHTLTARSEVHGIFDERRIAKNGLIPLTVGASLGLQLAGFMLPPVRRLLGIVRLSGSDWLIALGASVAPFIANEIVKALDAERDAHGEIPTGARP